MRKKIILTILLIIAMLDPLSAINMGRIIAYPIPYNPRSGNKLLTIDDGAGGPAAPDNIDVEILDINGDEVFSRSYSTFPVQWNGYNKKGKKVRPGFYILKIRVEDSSNGDYGTKILRILIRY